MEQDSPKIFSEECIFGPSQECPSYLKPIWSAFSIRSLSINGAKCAIIAAGATVMPYLDNIDDLTIEALTTKHDHLFLLSFISRESKERFMSCYKFFFVKNLATTVTLRALEHQLVDTVGEENGKEYFQGMLPRTGSTEWSLDCVDIAKTNPNNESKFELSKTVFDASLKRNFLNHVSIFLISALYDIIKYFKDIRSLAVYDIFQHIFIPN